MHLQTQAPPAQAQATRGGKIVCLRSADGEQRVSWTHAAPQREPGAFSSRGAGGVVRRLGSDVRPVPRGRGRGRLGLGKGARLAQAPPQASAANPGTCDNPPTPWETSCGRMAHRRAAVRPGRRTGGGFLNSRRRSFVFFGPAVALRETCNFLARLQPPNPACVCVCVCVLINAHTQPSLLPSYWQ